MVNAAVTANKLPELLSLTDCAFIYDLDPYRESLQLYFRQDWTANKFFALRKGMCICINSLKFMIVFLDGLDSGRINRLNNPRLVMSFRKRTSDDMGFVLITVDKKGW